MSCCSDWLVGALFANYACSCQPWSHYTTLRRPGVTALPLSAEVQGLPLEA